MTVVSRSVWCAMLRWVSAGLLASSGALTGAPAQFSIPAQPASAALLAFSKQAGVEVVFRFDDLKRRQSTSVVGEFEPEVALAKLLEGTDHVGRREPNGKWTIVAAKSATPPVEHPKVLAARRPDAPSRTVAANLPEGDKIVTLESITVTGSHIRRNEAEKALPVTIIDAAELEMRGGSTMADLFEHVALAEPSVIGESNYLHNGARGDVAAINLRGLGTGSTLTLINGRRMAPFPISTSEDSVPALSGSINYVPASLVSRVEILRDGASAIYGADAAAGVINNLVSRNQAGGTIAARAAVTQHGGANEFRFHVADGFWKGPTHISAAFEYYHRDALMAADRAWSREADLRLMRRLPAPWNGLPLVDAGGAVVRDNDLDNRQSITRYGVWQRGTFQADGSFVGARPAGNNGIAIGTTASAPSPVATMAANGQFTFFQMPSGEVVWKPSAPLRDIDSAERLAYANVNTWRMLLPKTDRVQLATFADGALTERVAWFGDLMFYRARSVGGYEPVNFNTVDMVDGHVPAENPWNPFGTRFYHPTGAPNADGTPRLTGTPAPLAITTGVRPAELRPRIFQVDSYAYRALAGLRGGGADWNWESALFYSGAQTHEYDRNVVRESRLRAAWSRTDASAYNPFGYSFRIDGDQIRVDAPYVNPPAVADALYDTAERFARTGLVVWDAKIDGRLWPLRRGGRIGVAAGAELRHETYKDGRPGFHGMNPPGSAHPPLLREDDNDVINSSPNIALAASRTVLAAYSEIALPFVTPVERKRLLDSLEVTLAGRFEHFSLHGQSAKPKASILWGVVPALKLRGSYSESFRAPNLVQTNVTPLRRQVTSTDYYRFAVTELPDDGTHPRLTLSRGNEKLRPEKAQSWMAGAVVDVPRVRGLSFTADYWRINQNDAFANEGAAAALRLDALYLELATRAELARGTPIDRIDLGSGTANYRGYNVARLPVTEEDRALFAAYNARQTSDATKRAPVGRFASVTSHYINLGGRDLEGYDLGLHYRADVSRLGQLTLRAEATRYLRREEQTDDASPVLSTLGQDGRVKWRASGSVAWRRGALSASWFTSYTGSFVDTSAATTEAVYRALGGPEHIRVFNDNGIVRYLLRVEPFILHNASAAYRFGVDAPRRWLRGVTVRIGINNVFDAEPPLVDEANAYAAGANVRGRQFLLELSRAF